MIQCIKDYNLESEYPSRDIEVNITKRQKLKESYRHCHASNAEQAQKKGKKRSCNSFAPKFQPQQPKSKCKLTTVAAAIPSSLPTPTSGNPQSSSSSVPYENNGHPGQFGVGASNTDISKGNCFHCGELGHWRRNCQKYFDEIICVKSLADKGYLFSWRLKFLMCLTLEQLMNHTPNFVYGVKGKKEATWWKIYFTLQFSRWE